MQQKSINWRRVERTDYSRKTLRWSLTWAGKHDWLQWSINSIYHINWRHYAITNREHCLCYIRLQIEDRPGIRDYSYPPNTTCVGWLYHVVNLNLRTASSVCRTTSREVILLPGWIFAKRILKKFCKDWNSYLRCFYKYVRWLNTDFCLFALYETLSKFISSVWLTDCFTYKLTSWLVDLNWKHK